MKLRRGLFPLLGLLVALSPVALVHSLPGSPSNLASRAPNTGLNLGYVAPPKLQKRTSIGDAPVDGKDGKPHQGPFVADPLTENRLSSSSGGREIDHRPAITTVDQYGQKIPQSNDGVMDDKDRSKAQGGTTGTEGGVSERDRQRKAEEARTGEKSENAPIPPGEKPPLPHSEAEKMKAKGVATEEEPLVKGTGDHDTVGLDKPEDLPDAPHDVKHPIPESAVKDHLDVGHGPYNYPPVPVVAEMTGVITPLHSFFISFTMIIFSEIGDKTFLVAALMAMKHDRKLVFSAAFGALIAMTVLSAILGHAVPTLIPKSLTNFAAAVLFLIFGIKLFREGMAMSPDEGVAEEMHEVEREISEKEAKTRLSGIASDYAMEAGLAGGHTRKTRSKSRLGSPPRSPSSSPEGKSHRMGGRGKGGLGTLIDGIHNLTSFLLSPAWVQTFVMTFLGEWGDRSQIATIAMAAGQDYWWVTMGAVMGHACCTGIAVVGGSAIAGKVSMRVVTIGGAAAFLVFGLVYLLEVFYA